MSAPLAVRTKRKSCLRCVTAKSRCHPSRSPNGSCERCLRLGRDCVFENLKEGDRVRKPTRIERLEEQIRQLQEQLQAQKSHAARPEAPSILNHTSTTHHTVSPVHDLGAGQDQWRFDNHGFTTVLQGTDDPPDVVDRGIITSDHADRLLDQYRTQRSVYFPFVVLSPSDTAVSLRQQSPFLFLSIITACLTADPALQRRLGDELRSEISRRIVLREERNLELLQGILVHIAWNQYHFKIDEKAFHLLLGIAVAFVVDLRLDRPSTENCMHHVNGLEEDSEQKSQGASEIRAMLGCFYICATESAFGKQPPQRHTAWVDTGCSWLSKYKQYASDGWLALMIETQCLGLRIREYLSNPRPNTQTSDDDLDNMIRSFQQDIVHLESAITRAGNVSDKTGLRLECKMLYLFVYEIALNRATFPIIPTTNSDLVHFPSKEAVQWKHLTSHLWTLLNTCHSLISESHEISHIALSNATIPIFNTIWYAYLLLCRLVTIPPFPGWDPAQAREAANLPELGRASTQRLEQWTNTVKLQDQSDMNFWYFHSICLKSMLNWYHNHVANLSQPLPTAIASNSTSNPSIAATSTPETDTAARTGAPPPPPVAKPKIFKDFTQPNPMSTNKRQWSNEEADGVEWGKIDLSDVGDGPWLGPQTTPATQSSQTTQNMQTTQTALDKDVMEPEIFDDGIWRSMMSDFGPYDGSLLVTNWDIGPGQPWGAI